MSHVTSKDGTTIAFETSGDGPVVLLVDGAMGYREHHGGRSLSAALSTDFTVVTYDRRGRGESTNTQPYAVDREIEDIEALIDAVEGPACLFGSSSGAALALKAAARLGDKVARLAVFEPPFESGDEARQAFATYCEQTAELLNAGRHGDAVALFLADMLPAEMIDAMRDSPEWQIMEAVAPTLAYDNAVMGDGAVPVEDARAVTMPALVLDGGGSMEFMRDSAATLARTMPQSRHMTLEDQTHQPSPDVLAPILAEFFSP
jgi:pimeloyl-ACP methyl ester carboxylesterase